MPSDPGAARPSRRVLMVSGLVALCVAAVVVVTGLVTRAHEASEVKTWTATAAIPIVTLVTPKAASGADSLTLPGNLQAFYNASIYSLSLIHI